MSGGYFGYANDSVCDDITGVYPDYDLASEMVKRRAKKAREFNCMEDSDLSELVYDVFCLIHSLDWYKSADNSEEKYRKDVDFFKRKWFKPDLSVKVRESIDSKLEQTKADLLKEFRFLLEDET